jgi:membrane protein YqaA with SNARE-associated domain
MKVLPDYVGRAWYGPVISILAALDNLIVIVPTDGFLITSSMLKPKRWFYFSFMTAVGSTLGAIFLAFLVEEFGLPRLLEFYPGLDQTKTWTLVNDFFKHYGLLCVFAVSLSPLMQQPAVIIASLAQTPYGELGMAIFAGRFIKFMLFAYIGSHAPALISKIWGVKDEMRQVGKVS